MNAPPPHALAAINEFAAGRPVSDIRSMAGNAGFSYGARVDGRAIVMRVPPPGVRLDGPADVLRQAKILEFLSATDIPVPALLGVGSPDRPWFAVERLDAKSIRPTEEEAFPPEATRQLSLQSVDALRRLHQLQPPVWLGEPVAIVTSVRRWERFAERAPQDARSPELARLRELLVDHAPTQTPISMVHGDFQWGNVLGTLGPQGAQIVALIDWELTHVGAALSDLGWLVLFSETDLWPDASGLIPVGLPAPGELADRYGIGLDVVAWFRAHAAFVFSILIGVNLGLHRSGKRHDPMWEVLAPAARILARHGCTLLS